MRRGLIALGLAVAVIVSGWVVAGVGAQTFPIFREVNSDAILTAIGGGLAEDEASGDGDAGTQLLCLRDDTLNIRSGTEGDYEPCHTNANGALWVLDVNSASLLAAIDAGVDIKIAGQDPLSEVTSATLQNAAVANGNGTLLTVNGYGTVVLTVNCATCSGGTQVNFEASEDGTNFKAITARSLDTLTTLSSTTTTSGYTYWTIPVRGWQHLRARVSAYSAGTVTVTGRAVFAGTDPYPTILGLRPDGTNLMPSLDTAARAGFTVPTANATGGASTLKFTSEQNSGDNEDEHAVCTAPCTIYSITATNHSAAVAFLRCENDTAANTTPGSETVELDLAIPGATTGAGFTVTFPVGALFSTALTCWVATGEADTDANDIGANDFKVFYTFKQ